MRRCVFHPVVLMPFRVLMTIVEIDADEIDHPEAHPALSSNSVGQCPHRAGRTFENHRFKAGGVVENHVRRRQHEVMMFVLHVEQPLRQSTRPMIIDVGQVGYAMRACAAFKATGVNRLSN